MAGLAYLLGMCCCSVKEDRSMCPCLLRIDVSGVWGICDGRLKLNVVGADGFLYKNEIGTGSEELDGDSGGSNGYSDGFNVDSGGSNVDSDGTDGKPVGLVELKVPRGHSRVIAVYGDGNLFTDYTGVDIPLGKECPPLFMYSALYDTSGEVCDARVDIHKNYCCITLEIKTSDDSYPFRLEVAGSVSGYDCGLVPVSGSFLYPMVPSGGQCRVNVPRQTDASLLLRIVEDDDVLREFALGEFIAASGYDWSAADLQDVTVSIDYAKTDVIFTIGDWEASYHFNVEI